MGFQLSTTTPIAAELLARFALNRAEWKSVAEAVDWLFHFLGARTATVFLKAAIWGISVSEDIRFSRAVYLQPFDQLPSTYAKSTILERKKWNPSSYVWYSDRHFETPQVAYIHTITDVPLLADGDTAFGLINEAIQSATEFCRLIEAVCTGRSTPMAYWLEFQDPDLDITFANHLLTWTLPEVHPRVVSIVELDRTALVENYDRYVKLSVKWRSDLRRSMDRFTLSQCRRELIDQVLDLTLAFEIAVSQKGDNLPPRWKVSVRTAQLIGGNVSERTTIRNAIGRLYELRNKATHGSTLAGAERETVGKCAAIYPTLLQRLLAFRDQPDWNSIEIESPERK